MDIKKLEALYESINPRPEPDENADAQWLADRADFIQTVTATQEVDLPEVGHPEFMTVLAMQVEILALARKSVDELTSFGRNYLRISDRTLAAATGVSHPTIAKRDTATVRESLGSMTVPYLRAELEKASGA